MAKPFSEVFQNIRTNLPDELSEKVKEPSGKLKDACWKGYTAVGMKMKDGRKVPNCVPVGEQFASDKPEPGREAVGGRFTSQQAKPVQRIAPQATPKNEEVEIDEAFNKDKKDPRGGTVFIAVNPFHGGKGKYEVTFKPNKGSARGRTKWQHVSSHDDEDEAVKAKHAYAAKHGYNAMKPYKANEEVEHLDEMPGANMDTLAVHKHLRKTGWSLTRTKGGHDVYTHPKSEKHIAVPRHRQLKAPLVRGIMKDAQVREDIEQMTEAKAISYEDAIDKHAKDIAHDYLNGGNEHLYQPPSHLRTIYGVKQSRVNSDVNKAFKKHVALLNKVSEEVEQIEEISQQTKQSYLQKAKGQVKELEPHAKSGEYRDIAKNMINRREKGIAMATESRGHKIIATKLAQIEARRKQEQEIAKRTEQERKQNEPVKPVKEEKGSWQKETDWKKSKPEPVDKSGAKHSAMSRAKHLAKMASRKKVLEQDNAGQADDIQTPAKKSLAFRGVVKNTAKLTKGKKLAGSDKFQDEPELNTQIMRNNF